MAKRDDVRARIEEIRGSSDLQLAAILTLNDKRAVLRAQVMDPSLSAKDIQGAIRLDAQLAGEFAPTEHHRLELKADLTLDSVEYGKRLAAARQLRSRRRPNPVQSGNAHAPASKTESVSVPVSVSSAVLDHNPGGEGGRSRTDTITTLPTRTDDISKKGTVLEPEKGTVEGPVSVSGSDSVDGINTGPGSSIDIESEEVLDQDSTSTSLRGKSE